MTGINVLVLRKGDPGPALPDVPIGAPELRFEDMVIIENGTLADKPAVAFHMRDASGNSYIVQTTIALFKAMMDAVKVVTEQFENKDHDKY
jgi:hypothetical protein